MQDTIQIHVNGEARMWRSEATVADLLRELDIRAERVAVELNLEIIDRSTFDQRSLKDGDRVEILGFIGGGAVDSSCTIFDESMFGGSMNMTRFRRGSR
ncbi:MAG: sulfur carrier protein ThiS [Nitrospira sp.]